MQAFLEKQSPLIGSVLLHVMLLLGLWLRVDLPVRSPQISEPLFIHVVQPPPPEPDSGSAGAAMSEVQRTSPAPSEQPTPDVASTSPDAPPEQPKPEANVAFETKEPPKDETPPTPATEKPPEPKPEEPKETPQPAPVTPQMPGPVGATAQKSPTTPLDEKTVEQWRADQQKREAEQEAQKSRIMTQVASITNAAGANQGSGVQAPFASAGSERGTVRSIDIAIAPKSIQERFMTKYRISVQNKRVSGGSHQSYINAVTTNRGTYVNSGAPGYYEVMTLSKEVLARMAELEEAELLKRNLDPKRSRVLEVVFGLREAPSGDVDLAVTRFRAEPIQ